MLEAGTARVTSCIRSHEWCTLQQWSGSLQACHERCLRPSRCLSLGVSRLSLQGRHCMVQDTACNHNLQFHCQVGLATRSKQQKFNKNPLRRKISSTQTTAGLRSGRARALKVPCRCRADKWLPRLVLPTLPGGLQFTASASCTLRADLSALRRDLPPSPTRCPSMPPMASIGPQDCEAGLKTAHDTWSKAKKHWCCQGPRAKMATSRTAVRPGDKTGVLRTSFPELHSSRKRSGLSCEAPMSIRAASTIVLRSLGPIPLTNAMGESFRSLLS